MLNKTRQLRIGIDIRILSAGFSGIPNYLRNILDNLQTIDSTNNYFLFEYPGCDYHLFNEKWSKVPVQKHVQAAIATQLFIPFQIKKLKLDLFLASDYVAPLVMPKKIKVFTFIYDLTFVHYPETMAWKRLLISRLFTPLSMTRSKYIVTISDFIKNDISRSFPGISPGKVKVIRCGAPHQWALPADYDSRKRNEYLLFVGNLEPRKNLINLVKALELIKSKNGMDISLHIVGHNGWKHRRTYEYIRKSAVRENIVFKGFLSEKELQKEYLNCKAFLFPSIYEGFGIPVLEALSLDCVVLTSKNTVMPEIAGDAALYFDPHNPGSIAETIISIYSSGFNRSKYLKNKDNIISKFSWKSAAQELLYLLNDERQTKSGYDEKD